MRAVRVAVFGPPDLHESVAALRFDEDLVEPRAAIIDLDDRDAVARAGGLARDVPRVFVSRDTDRAMIAALGVDPARVVASSDAAVVGPALMAALPRRPRTPTRTVLSTGVRGGVGGTLLVTNVARRLARRARVCVLDATGSGGAAWWLRCEAASWTGLEGLADEMTPDHLAVAATDAAPGLRVVGGPPHAPSPPLLGATLRAAAALDELVLVDGPVLFHQLVRDARPAVDRCLLLAYDEPWSRAALDAAAPPDGDWLILSQSRARSLGAREVFRSLPRDERAVAVAMSARERVGGELGRAYDDLAELLLLDAS